MRILRKSVDVEFRPTAVDIAEIFWSLDSKEKAEFFNHLESISGYMLAKQLQFVTDDPSLTFHGRSVMKLIGEYSKWDINEGD